MPFYPIEWYLIATKRLTETVPPYQGLGEMVLIVAVCPIQDKSDRTQTSNSRNCQSTFWCVVSSDRRADPVIGTGPSFDEGSLWVRNGINITDMIGNPCRWDLTVAK